MITDTDLDTFVGGTLDTLQDFRTKILQEQVAPLVGKTMMIGRDLKDPTSGVRSHHVLQATIVGADWTYEDGIDLKVTYLHPFTGKTVETKQKA